MLQIIRTLLWMVLLSLSESVTRGQNVTGEVGGNVLLPCSFTDPVPPNVFWRIDDDVVFNIINSKPSDFYLHDERFKGRVSSKEEWNKEGNFSIWLKNLTQQHHGTYRCIEPKRRSPVEVRLEVSDKSPSKGGAPAAGGALLLQVLLLSAVGLLSPCCC